MKLSPQEILPHRDPFLFVDEISKRMNTIPLQSGSSPPIISFPSKGHFPDYPVVPGVLLIETMLRGRSGAGPSGDHSSGLLFVLATIEKAKFRSQVRPGSRRSSPSKTSGSQMVLRQKGTITVNGTVAAEASLMCILVKGEE